MPNMNTSTTEASFDAHADDVSQLTHYLEDELGCSQIVLHKERRWPGRPIVEARSDGHLFPL